MQTPDELLKEAEIAHGHLCAGRVLGVRIAMLGRTAPEERCYHPLPNAGK